MEAVMKRKVYDYSQNQEQVLMADDPLEQLEVGMFLMVEYPRRIARVDRIGTRRVLEHQTDGRPKWVEHPCAFVTVTIPSMAIPGFVDELSAKATARNAESLLIVGDAPQWEEIWGVRSVKRLNNPPGVAAKREAGVGNVLIVGQLYCVQQTGRTNAEKSSPVVGTIIVGDVIPADLIPAPIFRTPAERAQDAINAKKRAEEREKQRVGAIAEAAWSKQIELTEIGARKQAEVAHELQGTADVADENNRLRAEIAAMKAEKDDEPVAIPPELSLPTLMVVPDEQPVILESFNRGELMKYAAEHGVKAVGTSADIIAQLRAKEGE